MLRVFLFSYDFLKSLNSLIVVRDGVLLYSSNFMVIPLLIDLIISLLLWVSINKRPFEHCTIAPCEDSLIVFLGVVDPHAIISTAVRVSVSTLANSLIILKRAFILSSIFINLRAFASPFAVYPEAAISVFFKFKLSVSSLTCPLVIDERTAVTSVTVLFVNPS